MGPLRNRDRALEVRVASDPAGDDLYPAAFRLARMYAILSPRILAAELKVDRARAERLLAEMERQGAVGPPIIEATGARESRVNIVEDRPPDTHDLLVGTDPALGRRTLGVAAGGALLGLLAVGALYWIEAGVAVARYFRAEVGSPVLAAFIGATLPLVGLLVGWLVEMPLRPVEELTPGWSLRARGAIWTGATILAVGFALLRLLS